MKDRYERAGKNLRFDDYQEMRHRARLADIADLKRFLPFFQKHPGIVTQMNLIDYLREHPDFPTRSLTYLRGKRTLLRKAGIIP